MISFRVNDVRGSVGRWRNVARQKAGRSSCRPFRAVFAALVVVGLGLTTALTGAESTATPSGAAILQDLRSFNTVATVLHIAAHPDDENTALITYFARGRGYRTGYLSLTRGEGGQNEIGPEFDEKLGVARTQELLAARRLDGGRQFFTRAIDFGFSKTPEETLRFWDRTQVLGDVVRIIRTFRPDVIITRFSTTGGGTHGHHTASGILGVEAFKLAGDPKAYPEQLAQGLTIWQPKRVVLNSGSMRNDIYAMSNDPSKKAERNKLLEGRSANFPVQFDPNEWHTLVVETVGDSMRASIDGKAVGFIKSPGIGHPTKSKIELGCGGKDGFFDDIKVWNAEAVK